MTNDADDVLDRDNVGDGGYYEIDEFGLLALLPHVGESYHPCSVAVILDDHFERIRWVQQRRRRKQRNETWEEASLLISFFPSFLL